MNQWIVETEQAVCQRRGASGNCARAQRNRLKRKVIAPSLVDDSRTMSGSGNSKPTAAPASAARSRLSDGSTSWSTITAQHRRSKPRPVAQRMANGRPNQPRPDVFRRAPVNKSEDFGSIINLSTFPPPPTALRWPVRTRRARRAGERRPQPVPRNRPYPTRSLSSETNHQKLAYLRPYAPCGSAGDKHRPPTFATLAY